MEELQTNYFKELYNTDISRYITTIETKKASLDYLSWATAWRLLKEKFPDATFQIYERTQKTKSIQTTKIPAQKPDISQSIPERNETEIQVIKEVDTPINYFTDGVTAWVKVGVTVCGITNIEMLPIMDTYHNPVPIGAVTSTSVSKSIQRALTKAIARHGIGLSLYEKFDDSIEQEETKVSQEEFDVLQKKIIDFVVKNQDNEKCGPKIAEFVSKTFKGKRLSQTTIADYSKLVATDKFFQTLGV